MTAKLSKLGDSLLEKAKPSKVLNLLTYITLAGFSMILINFGKIASGTLTLIINGTRITIEGPPDLGIVLIGIGFWGLFLVFTKLCLILWKKFKGGANACREST